MIWIRYQYFCLSKLFNFNCGFSAKSDMRISWFKDIYTIEKFTEINNFQMRKSDINLPLFTSDYDFQGTVVNRALTYLHGGEIRFTVPLRLNINYQFSWQRKGQKNITQLCLKIYKSLVNQRYMWLTKIISLTKPNS